MTSGHVSFLLREILLKECVGEGGRRERGEGTRERKEGGVAALTLRHETSRQGTAKLVFSKRVSLAH